MGSIFSFEDNSIMVNWYAEIEESQKARKAAAKKGLAIEYISATIDETNYTLTFKVLATNLTNNEAKIFITETNNVGIFNPKRFDYVINIGKKIKETIININLEKNATNIDGTSKYNVSITCDSLSAETKQFRLTPDSPNPSVCYLNLYGKKVYGDDTATKKMIVLTYKTSESALSVIKKGYVLNTLTSKVIDKINEAYKETETSGEKEQYFVVGKNGTISMLVHGNQEEITGAEKSLAHLDILDAGDSIDFAVHSHGFRFKDNGNVDISGNYVPSEKDVNSASLLIEIVLGFKKISTVSDTNPSIVSQIRREDYEKFIGFYNQDCEKEQTFLSMSLKKFTGIVNDIEKYQPKPQKK